MARPIPKKKFKVKEERAAEIKEVFDPKAQRKLERKIKDRLDEINERVADRYKWAKALYDQQPDDVKTVVDEMVKTMKSMAGAPQLVIDGRSYNVEAEKLNSIQAKSHLWIAMRLVIACAEWGIRIGNFKAPAAQCLRCGDPVKKSKPKKKVKKKNG